MTTVREPRLKPVAILDLRPTQITVGMREVKAKRKSWREEGTKKGQDFLGKHLIPVILGPKGRHYVIDHHHLARALHDEGVKDVAVTVIANLSMLDRDAFWFVMDNRDWTHPFDADGRRQPFGDLPKSVDKLVDDPFRSLAGELRRAGGFAKDTTPFSEFLWADFLRRRMKRKAVEISIMRSSKRLNCQKAWMPITCRVGAARYQRNEYIRRGSNVGSRHRAGLQLLWNDVRLKGDRGLTAGL